MKTRQQVFSILEKRGWKEISCMYFGGYASVDFERNGRVIRWIRHDTWLWPMIGFVKK